jgi:hypothetical protein
MVEAPVTTAVRPMPEIQRDLDAADVVGRPDDDLRPHRRPPRPPGPPRPPPPPSAPSAWSAPSAPTAVRPVRRLLR